MQINECIECKLSEPLEHKCIDCVNLCKTHNQFWKYFQCRVGKDLDTLYGDVYSDNDCKMFSQEVRK